MENTKTRSIDPKDEGEGGGEDEVSDDVRGDADAAGDEAGRGKGGRVSP